MYKAHHKCYAILERDTNSHQSFFSRRYMQKVWLLVLRYSLACLVCISQSYWEHSGHNRPKTCNVSFLKQFNSCVYWVCGFLFSMFLGIITQSDIFRRFDDYFFLSSIIIDDLKTNFVHLRCQRLFQCLLLASATETKI